MSRTSIIAILAGFGIVFSGAVTSEAVAFARVVQTADPVLLTRYAKLNPTSSYAQLAIVIAAKCKTNWVGGACGENDSIKDTHTSDRQRTLRYG